jgi:glycogen debranching enzyme
MTQDVIRVEDQYYILASAELADAVPRVLKHDDTFAVFDRHGDIHSIGRGQQGLFHDGTRFLSRFVMRVAGKRPLLLSSTLKDDNASLAVDLANTDVFSDGHVVLPADTVHVFRSALLWDAACHVRVLLRSYAAEPVSLEVEFQYESDFADIFEVRGAHRLRRGDLLAPVLERRAGVVLRYAGLDGVERRTHIEFSPAPQVLESAAAVFRLELAPRETTTLDVSVSCTNGGGPGRHRYDDAAAARRQEQERQQSTLCRLGASHAAFDELLARSRNDLHMMLTDTPQGPYPYAGVPWFSTPFGRDGIITALETLWVAPEIASGVLTFLAAHQASEDDPERDAEPGKIVHEMRGGEMAALGEIPFGRYYGSVDATPLFVVLAAAHFRRTADAEFARKLWPNVERALQWIDRSGDLDGDGFVEYRRRSQTGLLNQGWKDSQDAISHADGSLAEAPIALCEVQAYVYAAKRDAAALARALGFDERGAALAEQAAALRERFARAFWSDRAGGFALALDGAKRRCEVRASNAGHCLFAGIADEKQAAVQAATLMSDDLYSGWGIRTLGANERRYNPMSYHNGSVWPHDNALIAYGLSLYRRTDAATRVLQGMFEASCYMDLQRVPELFCGFRRTDGDGPTLYPVACAPQSWAAGAVFLLLQACLGMSVDAVEKRVVFRYPSLPPFLDSLQIRNLRVSGAALDLLLERAAHDVSVTVLQRDGAVEVATYR